MYRRLATTSPGRGFQGFPVTIFSALSFQRFPSTFRRTDRAKTAPVSNPMMCSLLSVRLPQPYRSALAIVEFREISGLGHLAPNRLSEYRYARCVLTPFESCVPSPAVSSHGLTAQDPYTVPDQPRQQWRLSRDLELRFLS